MCQYKDRKITWNDYSQYDEVAIRNNHNPLNQLLQVGRVPHVVPPSVQPRSSNSPAIPLHTHTKPDVGPATNRSS
jgi:hypothetical protein